MKVPVLFLIYNRPGETQQVFDRIATYRPKKLYVAGDGPKEGSDSGRVRQSREVLDHISWKCEVKTLFRDENLGCKKAVSEGISWFFENEEMGIILEDDCLPDQSFFDFCEVLLSRYKDAAEIGMIAGTNRFQDFFSGLQESYIFASNASIWGWASWRRAWKYYDVDMSDWPHHKASDFLDHHTFSFLEKWRRRAVYDDVYSGKIDTWDYQWTYARQKNELLSIVPKYNLIQNIGLTTEGTHVTNTALQGMLSGKMDKKLTHPKDINTDQTFDRLLSRQIISEGYLRNILYLLIKRPIINFLNR